MKIVSNMLDWVLDQILKRCPHNPRYVKIDIIEGDWRNGNQLQWCERCGAFRFTTIVGPATIRCLEWRRPRPLWCKPSHPHEQQ